MRVLVYLTNKTNPKNMQTHKVDADGRDVALRVRVVLLVWWGMSDTTNEKKIQKTHTNKPHTKHPKLRTAKRRSRHDLPTPESPIRSSLKR